jgi:hypothetical protein
MKGRERSSDSDGPANRKGDSDSGRLRFAARGIRDTFKAEVTYRWSK